MKNAGAITFVVLTLIALRGEASSSPCERAKMQLEVLSSQLELYRAAHGKYPASEVWVEALKHEGLMDSKETVRDPWGNRYEYLQRGDDYDLLSTGPDGKRGTTDDQVRAERFQWQTCKVKSGC